jgi:hypothetical protein
MPARQRLRGEMDEQEAVNDASSSSDSDAAAESTVFPVIERGYEPAPVLVDRLRFIDALLSSPSSPLE